MGYICLYDSCNFITKNVKLLEKHYNIIHNEQNLEIIIEDNEEEEIIKKYICDKCSKKYNSLYSYKNHCKNCKGINILSCHKCLKPFSCKQSKYKHIKDGNCIPITNNTDNTNNTNNTDNTNNTNNTNNITNNYNINIVTNNNYNNYKDSKSSFITDEMFVNILSNDIQTIKNYIICKHFNDDFTENHNIQYNKKIKRCLIKENNKWREINIDSATDMLISDNSPEMAKRYQDNKQYYNSKIQNKDKIAYLQTSLYYTMLQILDKKLYNKMRKELKDVIRNTNADIIYII